MAQYQFMMRAKEEFRYLTSDYGFSVADEKQELASFGNSLVQFASDVVDIRVTLDRGQVLLDLRPSSQSQASWFSLASVLGHLAPGLDEPAYVFPDTWDDYYQMVDWQLVRLAHLFHRVCDPILTGEFSPWETIAKSRSQIAEREYRMLTGKEPIRIDSNDAREAMRYEMHRRGLRKTQE